MKRRNFLRSSLGAGLAAGAFMSFSRYENALAGKPLPSAENYDLIAVMGGEPAAMFDMGIQSLGGMGTFVRKGQKVLVKPNIGWDVVPEKGANTNPALVKRIIEHCYRAGAKEVYVFDNTCDNWIKCYKNSGIEQAVKDAGGKIVPGNSESYYHEITIPNGKKLTKTKVHELVLESDVFINVPVLKNHSSAMMTGALKNMMGVIWDRGYWHRNNLNQCIADYALYSRKPSLHITDAYNVMMRNGPRGVSVADLSNMKSLLISTDWVAIDAAGAKMMGKEPSSIEHITLAAGMGIGKMDLASMNIHRLKM
ncbi:MAG: DUF362 domain-containing protein [Bacteroidales bacterium]|jgi:uncharacterized protein (DUF362 family)|nr:DUF362 domain-containing protein [Bacteroidales bacterium]